jgi:hypothetical protein
MTTEVYHWIVNASSVSALIPLAFLLIFWTRQPKQNRILAISLLISFIFDSISWTLMTWYTPRTTVLTNNLYFIIAFPAIMWFYHETLSRRFLKILVRIFMVSFLLLALVFALDQGLTVWNSNTMTLSSILITITSFFFVADLNLMDQSNFLKNRFHETNILLNTSLALYYFSTIVMFAVSGYVFSHTTPEGGRFFWSCHNGLNILKNIGLAFAFYLSAKRMLAEIDLQRSGKPKQTLR